MDSITLINLGLLFGALLIVVGIASSLVASRFGAPLLLVFLGLGMLLGEDGPGGIPFNDYEVTSPAWGDGPLWTEMAREADRLVGGGRASLVIDDTALPKKGTLSVGVARQD